MLETCWVGLGLINLCIEMTNKFDQFLHTTTMEAKMDQIFNRPVFPIFEAS